MPVHHNVCDIRLLCHIGKGHNLSLPVYKLMCIKLGRSPRDGHVYLNVDK